MYLGKGPVSFVRPYKTFLDLAVSFFVYRFGNISLLFDLLSNSADIELSFKKGLANPKDEYYLVC